jgi:nucleoside-specific outer membrane channel protein Tsx
MKISRAAVLLAGGAALAATTLTTTQAVADTATQTPVTSMGNSLPVVGQVSTLLNSPALQNHGSGNGVTGGAGLLNGLGG